MYYSGIKLTASILLPLFIIGIFLTASARSVFPQSCYNPEVERIINTVNPDTLSKFTMELTGEKTCIIGDSESRIISRYWKSSGNQLAAQYIFEKFMQYGLNAQYWQYSPTGTNVFGFKTGTVYPEKLIILSSHYDNMINGTVPDTTYGADDNASGTCALFEAARVLQNINLPYTVLFAAFDEEERMLFGSDAYADSCKRLGIQITAVLNLDMIAYDGDNDGVQRIGADSNSIYNANLIISAANIYLPSLNPAIGLNASDEISFTDRGYTGNLIIEETYPDFNPYYHTIEERFNKLNLNYFSNSTKEAIAYLLILSNDYIINFEHTPLSNTNDTSGREAVFVIKSAYGIGTGVRSPKLYYKSENTGFSMVSPYSVSADTFRFIIPGHPKKSLVSYYVAAVDSAGMMVSSYPAGGKGFDPPGSIPPGKFLNYYVYDNFSICSGTLPKVIPPSQSNTFDSVIIPLNGIVLDIDVNVSLEHSNDSDLIIWILRSGFAVHVLSNRNGADGDNYINTTFDDDAVLSIKEGVPPFTGIFKPEMPLSNFNNSLINGLWKLKILNLSPSASGTLLNWCLITKYYDPIGIINNQFPAEFSLSQNYPNPFNSSTSISFNVAKMSAVKIILYDITGREIMTFVNGEYNTGNYLISANLNNISSGIYFYIMYIDGTKFKTKKMILIK